MPRITISASSPKTSRSSARSVSYPNGPGKAIVGRSRVHRLPRSALGDEGELAERLGIHTWSHARATYPSAARDARGVL